MSMVSSLKNKRSVAFTLVLLTLVDFLFGIALTFWYELPEGRPGSDGTNWLLRSDQAARWSHWGSGSAQLAIHSSLGTLLAIASLWLVWLAYRSKQTRWLIAAIAGVVGLVGAAAAGSAFVAYDSDALSFVMSAGFVLALVAYMGALMIKPEPVVTKKR
jgi:hypothetical protein